LRKKLVAGNWKMYKNLEESLAFVRAFRERALPCALIPPFPFLAPMAAELKGSAVALGAQNCHWEVQGAFTGEVSPEMLASVGAAYVLVGHSERRQYFAETDDVLAQKTDAVLRAGLEPIFCVGEALETRNEGRHFELVSAQLRNGLFHLSDDAFGQVTIAYEPVWAIGTGVTATPGQAQEMHAFIRAQIVARYGHEIADATTIQYGGSVKPDNATELFSQPDVDGGLVGGASLKPEDFLRIVEAIHA
jgi:triosephosphate isomerase